MYYYYLLVLGGVLFQALSNVLLKKYQLMGGVSISSGLYFNALIGLLSALIFFGYNGFRWECAPFSLALAGVQGILAVAYTLVGFRIMKESVSLYSLFLLSGNMILPYIWGLAFLNEAFSPLRMIGLLTVLLSAVLFQASSVKAPSKTLIILCAVVFLLGGAVAIVSKVHQVETAYPVVSSAAFVMLVNISKSASAAVAGGAIHLRSHPRPTYLPLKKVLLVALAYAFVSGLSYVLQLDAAVHVPASVMYPMITGGSVIFSAVMAMLFFGERLTKRQWMAIALCIGGTCMFL